MPISNTTSTTPQKVKKTPPKRQALKRTFLMQAGWAEAQSVFLAGDASNRHYERLSLPEGTTAVLMDAPPKHEPIKPFIEIGDLLLSQGLSAPEIFHASHNHGFLLLEDMGNMTYGRALKEKAADQETLYTLAVDILISLHKNTLPSLPPFDWTELKRELNIFIEWYAPISLGRDLTESEQQSFFDSWEESAKVLEPMPQALVLRDFHIDNLMYLDDRKGLCQCGILDFQDALIGPAPYDLVSLLEDARRDVPPALQAKMKGRYLAAFPDMDPETFNKAYNWLGAQRSTKILGIFTRLYYRDGKKAYLQHIPRVWAWLAQDLKDPALRAIHDWFANIFPKDKRIIPDNPRLGNVQTTKDPI
jgi:aminoglycoside/choline kinase family phosphotransferase